MDKKTILLIDDDCDDAEFFSASLSGAENTMLKCAGSGAEALQMLSTMDPAPVLILLDAGMPGMNGWECLTILKKDSRFKQLPVVMVATSSRQNGIYEARDLGAAAYMIKPSRFNDLKYMMQLICSDLEGELEERLARLEAIAPQSVFVFPKN